MTANVRVLVNPIELTGNQVNVLSQIIPTLPKCNPKVIHAAQYCIGYTKDLFLKGLNSTLQSRIRPFENSGKILTTVYGKNCSTAQAGSLCYQVVANRFLEPAALVWRDFLDVQNWNATGSKFLYQARVHCGGMVCEKLYASGMIYTECEGVARNGTIFNLPLLRKLCEIPQTAHQAINQTIQQVGPTVVCAANEETTLSHIFSNYVLSAAPIATSLASAWAIHKAISSYDTDGVCAKTCAYGVAAIAGIAATALMM